MNQTNSDVDYLEVIWEEMAMQTVRFYLGGTLDIYNKIF